MAFSMTQHETVSALKGVIAEMDRIVKAFRDQPCMWLSTQADEIQTLAAAAELLARRVKSFRAD